MRKTLIPFVLVCVLAGCGGKSEADAPPVRGRENQDSPLPEVLVACALALGLVAGVVARAHS